MNVSSIELLTTIHEYMTQNVMVIITLKVEMVI